MARLQAGTKSWKGPGETGSLGAGFSLPAGVRATPKPAQLSLGKQPQGRASAVLGCWTQNRQRRNGNPGDQGTENSNPDRRGVFSAAGAAGNTGEFRLRPMGVSCVNQHSLGRQDPERHPEACRVPSRRVETWLPGSVHSGV